jgi:hypothetical protein
MTDETKKNEPLVFEGLEMREETVAIGPLTYTLKEATEAAASRYRNYMTSCTKLTDGKVTKITGDIAGAQSLLLSLCLYDSENVLVPVNTIKTWPSRVVKQIFERAQLISDLKESDGEDKKVADKVKNE